MTYQFLPAIPGECLPCEKPSELVARIASRDGVRGLLKMIDGDVIRVYSGNDPNLSEEDLIRIKASARSTVLAALAYGELNAFVRCDESGSFHRVPTEFWSWWMAHNFSGGRSVPDVYEASPLDAPRDARFIGSALMIAKADGDSMVGNLPPRPVVTTSVLYTPSPTQPRSETANENAGPVPTNKNGCQGRPSVLHLCEAIMRERHADSLTLASITAEAYAIIDAFKQDDRCRHLPPPGHSTVKNGLGKLYKQLTGVVDWPDRDRGQ